MKSLDKKKTSEIFEGVGSTLHQAFVEAVKSNKKKSNCYTGVIQTAIQKPKELCKCGKPLPICPNYCSKCGEGTMGNKKLVVVGEVKPKELEYVITWVMAKANGIDDYNWGQKKFEKDLRKKLELLLTQQRTELLEEIKKIINEELLVCPYCFNRIKDDECTACDHYDGYSVEKRIEQINENINLLNKKV